RLLALLVLRHDRAVDRIWLAGTLWPDSSDAQALANLRSSLKNVRRALGREASRLASPTPRALALELEGAEVDLIAFGDFLQVGDTPSLQQAVELYRGPLLEGWTEEWAVEERQVREAACLAALERLADVARQVGEPAQAERHLRRAVALDPLCEAN